MKQLLHCCDQVALAALNERAFLVVCDSQKKIVELLPPDSPSSEKSDDSGSSENPIQAVAIEIEEVDSQIFWCAVSRLDKTLAMYRVDLADDSASVSPKLVHKSKKRIGCLSFASVPTAPSSTEANQSTAEGSLVVLAGDLIGDAWAFNVAGPKPETRFLLGHTASMLTGIKAKRQTLLTSDRDEKIRVTAFPETMIVKGFFLGHEAYVSAIDVAEASPICVSCSGGDGSVRIWDYEKMSALGTWSENSKKESSDGENDVIRKTPARVAIDNEASFVAVIHDQCKTMHILRVNGESEEKSLELLQTIECSDQAVSVAFTKDGKILVSLKDPSYIQAYSLVKGDSGSELFEATDLPGLITLRKIGVENGIIMPESALEKDKQGVPTLHKISESRTTMPVDKRPWNNSERISIAKERNKRHRKRRKLAGKT